MLIRIIIIEDEALAVSRLKRILLELEDSFEIIAECNSVLIAKKWFAEHHETPIDLIFSDIQLLDGTSFEIFDAINRSIPIIFTTAFDTYLMKAFKTYGIEYLLKPFGRAELESAILKYKTIKADKNVNQVSQQVQSFLTRNHGTSFPTIMSYNRHKIIPLKSEFIRFFGLEQQMIYAYTDEGKYLLGETLNQVQEKLPQNYFYRANRQTIIQKKFIQELEPYLGGRLCVKLDIPHDLIIISKDNCKAFKDWLQS